MESTPFDPVSVITGGTPVGVLALGNTGLGAGKYGQLGHGNERAVRPGLSRMTGQKGHSVAIRRGRGSEKVPSA